MKKKLTARLLSSTSLLVPILLLPILLAVGCGRREDPILVLAADEALEIGKQYLANEKYERARRHLVHAFEVEPNSRVGREALLLAADALYQQGGTDNYIKCEAKYRDFLNRFPTSELAGYAQFKVADCLAARTERPDRDQKMTRSAIEAFEELLRLYPNSEYVPEARQRMRELTNQLAAHELVVAVFYNRYGGVGICDAAINRLEYLRERYPDFDNMDGALLQLAIGYHRCGRPAEALEALQDLRRRFPDSEFLDDASEWQERVADALIEKAKEAKAEEEEAKEDGGDGGEKVGDAASLGQPASSLRLFDRELGGGSSGSPTPTRRG
ncbi:MAG: outer membrane protein assembly factor BamD [Holophagales bacterium]|nr:outer membrane protein assembly factor BamD [Holophagales bacterium]